MTDYGLPILATLALWWGSTGRDLLRRQSAAAHFPLHDGGRDECSSRSRSGACWRPPTTQAPGAAYGAFSYGLICWGWQIVSFYTGFVTGPRRTPCPPELRGLARFVEAVRTSLYHELFALVGAVVLLAITHGPPNQLGVWTYVTLWWMHESAKLNVFFGVPNLGEECCRDALRYLASFMTRRPMNLFFPFSVTISTVVTVLLVERAAMRADAFRSDRLHHAGYADGAGRRRALVPGRAAQRQCAVGPLSRRRERARRC